MPKKKSPKLTEIYVLMEDDNGGMFSSHPDPTGEAVVSKETADEWVEKDSNCRSYKRVYLVETPSE